MEAVIASAPENLGVLFEKVMLETVVSGVGACIEQWTTLLASQPDVSAENATRFFALFRSLINGEGSIEEATAVFLSGVPNHDAVTDLLHYLMELSALNGEPADRARRCRRLIEEWERPGRS